MAEAPRPVKTETTAWDGMSNVSSFTDRKSQATTFTYDALNRRTLATHADSTTIEYTYDAANRLTEAEDSVTGSVTRVYDNLDRITSETTPAATVAYTWDAGGRRSTMTASNQAQISYAYDNAHRLTSITQGSNVVSFGYDNANRRTSVTLPNGIVGAYTYDDASQLASLVYTLSSTTVGDLVYAYDGAGRRTQVTGSLAKTGLPSAVSSTTYDAANRLTAWGSATLTYDDNGSLTSDGSLSLTWDARNRLASISGGASASFTYDALGRRLSKTVSSTTTQFVYDGLNPVQERSGGAAVADMITGFGIDEFFRRTDSTGARDFLTDALGSTRALTDSSGVIQTSYSYEPYGKATATGQANGNPYQYTGRENDGTGLYYYRARFYHPGINRFVSQDPIGLAGGVNVYAYVEGNPLSNIDPTGECPWCVAAGIGALMGGGMDLAFQLLENGGQLECIDLGSVGLAALAGAALSGMPGVAGLGVASRAGKAVDKSLGANPFKGKTAQEVAGMLERRGYVPKGPDAVAGRGTYVNPQTGRGYHVNANHPEPKGPHVGVHRPRDMRDTFAPRDYPMGNP